MNALYTIIGLFALGAIIGMYLLTLVLKNKKTPKAAAFIHGAFVGLALILLIIYVSRNAVAPVASLVLFIVAALGGFVLIYRDLMGKPIPKWLAVGHGLIAVTAFIFLLVHAFAA